MGMILAPFFGVYFFVTVQNIAKGPQWEFANPKKYCDRAAKLALKIRFCLQQQFNHNILPCTTAIHANTAAILQLKSGLPPILSNPQSKDNRVGSREERE